jgi:hypothetical protein
MNSTRGCWLRSLVAGLGILATPVGASTLWAQGFGADPFQPYNSQYNPYTYPMGPASPEAGQGGPRSGVRGANQFQNYLNDIQGTGRENERYGIGTPYYRSSVDPAFDPNGKRQYRPNAQIDRAYEQNQEKVTRKYLAYFSEKDPKKRAALLKDYNRARGQVSRSLATRRESQFRDLDDLPGLGSGVGRSTPAAESRARSSSLPPAPRARDAVSDRDDDSSSMPPPPPIFSSGSRGIGGRRTPSEILNRSRRLTAGDDDDIAPNPSNARRPSTARRPPPPPTASDN